jgi:hypothetical protein
MIAGAEQQRQDQAVKSRLAYRSVLVEQECGKKTGGNQVQRDKQNRFGVDGHRVAQFDEQIEGKRRFGDLHAIVEKGSGEFQVVFGVSVPWCEPMRPFVMQHRAAEIAGLEIGISEIEVQFFVDQSVLEDRLVFRDRLDESTLLVQPVGSRESVLQSLPEHCRR